MAPLTEAPQADFGPPVPARPPWLVSWFVRRAGLARCTTFAAVVGFIVAALAPGWHLPAVAALTCALVGMLAGHGLGRARPLSKAPLPLLFASVVLMGLSAGLLLGTLRLSSLLSGVLPTHVSEAVRAELVFTGPVSSRAGWQSGPAEVVGLVFVRTGRTAGLGERVFLEIGPSPAAGPVLHQGARVFVLGTLAAPRDPTASGYDQAERLRHQGISVVLKAASPAAVTYLGRRGGLSGWFDRLRESVKAHLARGPDARVNAVLQGVVLGDTEAIDEGWMEAFRRSGTAHMLSVSGLHVASLAGIVIALAGLARLSRRASFVLAAIAAALMIPLVGPSPPIIRAVTMMAVVLAGRLVGRRRDQWQGLGFAALVVLGINPFAAFDVGFQLSFSAFAGMIALVRPLERLLHRVPEAARANLAVSVAATLGTAPVSLVAFGRTSLIAPIANLLVVPTLGAVTGLGLASALLGFIWTGLSGALDTLASLPLMWTVLVSTLCGRAPVLEAGYTGMALTALVAGVLVVPAALLLAGRPVAPPGRLRLPGWACATGWLRRRRPPDRRWATALGCLLVAAAAALGAAAYPMAAAGVRSAEYVLASRSWPGEAEVRVLDVGQGTAVLLRTPDHHAALFDAGPAGRGLSEQLRSLGVRRLDLVVISHPHADHFAGLPEVLEDVEVRAFVDRVRVESPIGGAVGQDGGAVRAAAHAGGAEARQYMELRAMLEDSGCTIMNAASGAALDFHGTGIRFYAAARPLVIRRGSEPWGDGRGPPGGDELNDGSLVVVIERGGTRYLLPGDAEAGALARYPLPAADVIVVGHHGSRGAVNQAILERLHPRLAVISVGKENSFGHPASEVLAALETASVKAVRTDQSGWVSLRTTDGALAVSTERTQAP